MYDETLKIYKQHHFFEHSKYSFLEYLLREIVLPNNSCRADLQERFIEESRKRLRAIIRELEEDKFKNFKYYELAQDILKLDGKELKEKYKYIRI